eukprot:gb/GFBE01039211.1/.p1 GENE.gb/GFBE01039211.1/~~gb/GFBE01039211.1/.p1  ORF type:complete len:638 (+),score=84.90 gb/GFBE01039211.1/:1-1914(+)
MEYPLQLGLAYLLFVGYFMRTVFVSAKLPGAVGVLLSGFIFSHFMQTEIMEGRNEYQATAFFLVLLTAGCELSIKNIRPSAVIVGLVPCTIEIVGLAVYAHWFLDFKLVESLVIGTILFPLGDGLVIPKMGEFGQMFPKHHLPRLMFTCAPLEASWALTLFGIIEGFAEPMRQPHISPAIIVLANIVRLVATVFLGILLGWFAGALISWRTKLSEWNIKFTLLTAEAYLILLAVALAAFSLGLVRNGVALVPMGFSPGPMFQAELLVIVLGSSFGYRLSEGGQPDTDSRKQDLETLHCIESTMGGVWVFGQLILFSMLGSKSDVSVFTELASMPLLLVGLACRFVGVLVAVYGCKVVYGTLETEKCDCDGCAQNKFKSAWHESLFIFLASLPRATIQGALGQVPITERFFASDPHRSHVQRFILCTAKLQIVVMSVIGSLLLHILGPTALECTKPGDKCYLKELHEEPLALEDADHPANWKDHDRERLAMEQQRSAERIAVIALELEALDPAERQDFIEKSHALSEFMSSAQAQDPAAREELIEKSQALSEFLIHSTQDKEVDRSPKRCRTSALLREEEECEDEDTSAQELGHTTRRRVSISLQEKQQRLAEMLRPLTAGVPLSGKGFVSRLQQGFM